MTDTATGEAPARAGRRRRGRILVACGAVLVVVAAGVAARATGTWPFRAAERYCWGAWTQDSGPGFLGDDAFDDGHGSRAGTGSAPTARHPRGSCTVTVHTWFDDVDGDERTTVDTRVTVRYGPAPAAAAERAGWFAAKVGRHAVPLPDGLPGTVDGTGGLVVLPPRCDQPDGRPTVVALDSTARMASRAGPAADEPGAVRPRTVADTADLGGLRSVAVLLVAAADRGMAATGCRQGHGFTVTSPMLTTPDDEDLARPACRIPGLTFTDMTMSYQVGAVTPDLQSCSVRGHHRPVYDAVMTAQPRLAALVADLAGSRPAAPGWRGTGVLADGYGVLRADCAGRPVTFVTVRMAVRDVRVFTDAVTERLGCAPLAPRG